MFIEIKIDKAILDRGSYIEVRKRKDEIVVTEIPKGKQIKCIPSNGKE